MAWIESHQSLRDHPKTKRLCRQLNINSREAVGLLQFLWWWAYDYAPEGDLSRFSDEDIADALAWTGDPKPVIAALISAGFMDEDRRLHDWSDYAQKWIERRRANSQRMRIARAALAKDTNDPRGEHVQDTCKTRVGLPTGPDRTGPNQLSPTEIAPPSGVGADAPRPKDKARSKPKSLPTPAPAEIALTDKHYEYAERIGLDREQVAAQTDAFLAHHRFKGTRGVDWYSGWQNWMRNAVGRFAASPARAPAARANMRLVEPSKYTAEEEAALSAWADEGMAAHGS